MMKKLLIAAVLLSASLAGPALADKAVKDASGTNFNMCTTTVSTTEVPCHQVKNAAGTTIDPATAQNQATANSSLSTIATNSAPGIYWNGATGAASALTGSAGATPTFTGAMRDSGVAAATFHPFAYFNAFFLTDQAATVYVDCSNDGATWYTCASNNLSAAVPIILQVPVMTRYHRARITTASTTAETYLWVNTSYSGA